MPYFIISIISCVITSVVCNAIFYAKSSHGSMDMEWNDEDGVWNAHMHIPSNINYSKKKKLIIKINHR